MKLFFTTLLIFSLHTSVLGRKFSCSGTCAANCKTWAIEYTTDCNGNIDEFVAIYYYGGSLFSMITHLSDPGFVGMDPGKLDASCESEVCA